MPPVWDIVVIRMSKRLIWTNWLLEGTCFTDCFCASGTCVPSRVSYLTGQYCHTHGVYGNDGDTIPGDLLSLPTFLQRHGYQTAIVGKKHLPHWENHGFEYQRLNYTADAGTRGLHYYKYLLEHGLHGMYDHGGDFEKYCLSDLKQLPLKHSLEVWTGNETIEYLKNNRDLNKPFFLQTSFERPHSPNTIPEGCPFIYDPDKITLPKNEDELPLNSTMMWQSQGFVNRQVGQYNYSHKLGFFPKHMVSHCCSMGKAIEL